MCKLLPTCTSSNALPPSGTAEKECLRRACSASWRASFIPLAFTTSGRASPAATVVLKRLAAGLAEVRDLSYSTVMDWLRCWLSFCLLRCAVMYFRGSRSRCTTALDNVPNLPCSSARVNFATCMSFLVSLFFFVFFYPNFVRSTSWFCLSPQCPQIFLTGSIVLFCGLLYLVLVVCLSIFLLLFDACLFHILCVVVFFIIYIVCQVVCLSIIFLLFDAFLICIFFCIYFQRWYFCHICALKKVLFGPTGG